MEYISYKEKNLLKNHLNKLNKHQFKLFFSIIIHYWLNFGYFISKQNFMSLWCELNALCHEINQSFPEPHDDHDLMKSYCQAHPFYFIDMLDLELVQNLFSQYLNDHLEILIVNIDKLHKEGLRPAYDYINKTLGLTENIDDLTKQTKEYIISKL